MKIPLFGDMYYNFKFKSLKSKESYAKIFYKHKKALMFEKYVKNIILFFCFEVYFDIL